MIFKDKVYQDMEWLEKVCEPIVCDLNDILNKLPDSIEITYDMIVKDSLTYVPSYLSADIFIETHSLLKTLDWTDKKKIVDCFSVVIEGEPILDMEAKTLTGGNIKLVKTKEKFEEKEIQSLIGVKGVGAYLNGISHKKVSTDRLNEILELLGEDKARRSRSPREKMFALRVRFMEIMENNEWNIRDVALSNRVSLWVRMYLLEGNLAGYMNFCKLKVMTHEDAPIYSVEGEEEL